MWHEVPGEEAGERRTKKVPEEIKAANLPNLAKDISVQLQEAKCGKLNNGPLKISTS